MPFLLPFPSSSSKLLAAIPITDQQQTRHNQPAKPLSGRGMCILLAHGSPHRCSRTRTESGVLSQIVQRLPDASGHAACLPIPLFLCAHRTIVSIVAK
jgi:hypothetical protein